MSVKTVSTHRTRMLKKMRLKNNADIIHYALRNELVR
ncbi:MAG: LuxR C-terminal-related transcriptional regulator [Candidatus Methylomirabilales bacterium]